jgi:hypothetical protein
MVDSLAKPIATETHERALFIPFGSVVNKYSGFNELGDARLPGDAV